MATDWENAIAAGGTALEKVEARDDLGRWTSGGGVTPDEREALGRYKENSAVNAGLRGETDPGSAGDPAENRRTVRHLDAVLARSRLSRPTTLYRSMGYTPLQSAISQTGRVSNKGYTSASRSEPVARSFSQSTGDYLARIELPAGHAGYEYEDDPQQEVLLPRNLRLRVAGVDHLARTVTLRPDKRKG